MQEVFWLLSNSLPFDRAHRYTPPSGGGYQHKSRGGSGTQNRRAFCKKVAKRRAKKGYR